MDSGDFCLHADPDGKAYIWFERPHFQMICATLTEDYTAVTDEYSVHYDGLLPPLTREAMPLPETEQRHKENTAASSYVWLPIEWQGEKPVIRWQKEWRLED